MLNAFVSLFTEAEIWYYLLMILSISLFVLDLFFYSFRVAPFAAVLTAIGAITQRCVSRDNTSTEIIFYIIYSVLILIVLVSFIKLLYRIIYISINNKKYQIVDGEKIPLTKEGNLDYSFLVGKKGVTVTDLKPIGKINIEDKIYEATSVKDYIYTGVEVVVEKIADSRIVVKLLDKTEEEK